MTSAEVQTVLNTIYNQIDGKTGDIYSISISSLNGLPGATVNIDWAAFKANFSGSSAQRNGSIWSKTVSNITYTAKQDDNAEVADTVPT